MSEFWHALNVVRFSWIDLLWVIALMGPGFDLCRAFVRGWRRSAEKERQRRAEDAGRQRYWDAVRSRRDP